MQTEPCATIFVQNIQEKLKKHDLRKNLYYLFGAYGHVIDVVATRAPGMRGTAFVVFDDTSSAQQAFRHLDGERFFSKQLKLSFAKSRSHATILQEDGPDAFIAAKVGRPVDSSGERVTVSHAQRDADRRRRADEDESDEEHEAKRTKVDE